MAYTTINKSTDYFNTKLYTGNGGTQTITGVGFQPDFTWVKGRNHAYYHYLQDVVRGSQNILYTNNTDSQATITAGISAWNADGYVTGSQGALNYNGRTFVAWNWKAGGAGSANTDGSINSTVSVNQTAGFSIVKWTGNNTAGATVGHGLGSIPKIVIVKNSQQSGYDWVMYHASLGNTKRIWLNLTNAESTNTSSWNNTTPSSSLFTLGSSGETNGSGEMIGYCFAEKQGYSKFGSYKGNGNADGTFIYTGFKPAFVLAKKTNEANTSWIMLDNKRLTSFNPIEVRMFANVSSAEDDINTSYCDLVSNGFKIRNADNNINDANDTYIYMAFAEAPLVGTNDVTAKAR